MPNQPTTMVRTTTLVEVTPVRTVAVAAVGFLAILLIAALYGAFGTSSYLQDTYYAYDCKHENHTWDPHNCKGVQLSQNGTVWSVSLPKVNALNGYLELVVYPYNVNFTTSSSNSELEVDTKIKFSVSLYGSSSRHGSQHSIVHDDEHEEALLCDVGEEYTYDGECYPFVLVNEGELLYSYYSVRLALLDSPGRPFVGDVKMIFSRLHDNFSILQITVRAVYFVISLMLGIAWVAYTVKSLGGLRSWSFEQRFVLLLLISLLLFNNPAFYLVFTQLAWMFDFLDALFFIIFQSVILLFCFFIFEHFKDDGIVANSSNLLKLILILIYAILCAILLNYLSIKYVSDPVYSSSVNLSWPDIVYYLISLVYAISLVWIMVAMLSAVFQHKRVEEDGQHIKVLFVAGAITLLLSSAVMGFFWGSYGPFQISNNTLSFLYFFTLNNLFVWWLMLGFMPRPIRRFSRSNPSEASPLFDAKFALSENDTDIPLMDRDFSEANTSLSEHAA